jgi:hypothetical protein
MQTIGFLSIATQGDGNGSIGGYLITDLRGNPLRFYSTPERVAVDKVQRLLLGKGFQRYVHCDLLGKSLVEKDGSAVTAVLCEQRDLLALRKLISIPLGVWCGDRLEPHEAYPQDREVLDGILSGLDLVDGPLEVFERIREALIDGAGREEKGE